MVSCSKLGIDTACLTVLSSLEESSDLFWQSQECQNCDLIALDEIEANINKSFIIDSTYGYKLRLNSTSSSCSFSGHFVEHGQYYLYIKPNDSEVNSLQCNLITGNVPDPIDTYLPLIYSCLAFLAFAIFWTIFKEIKRRGVFQRLVHRNSQDFIVNNSAGNLSPDDAQSAPQKERLRSLDTFRGIAIVVMIFVNYGGGKYFFLDHLPWNGLAVADLVFPWFIWIMGVSMAISLRSISKRELKKFRIFWKILKRSIILFALGLILNTSYNANDLTKLRIPGVLQRFSISYLCVATLHMFCSRTTDSHTDVWWSKIRDVCLYWPEWLFMFSLIIVHTCLTFAMEVPGCPKGYLGPGGLHDHGQYANCTGGVAGYIDRQIFGEKHIYAKPTCHKIYATELPYDPEGLLGCLTSIFLVFLGLQAGKILLTYKEFKQRLSRWIAWGLITGISAAIFCKASKNDGWIPVNKNLWSLSYVLTTGSFAFFLLSFCYFVQDVKKWWSGSPFFYPGMNSILLYVGHQLTGSLFPWYWEAQDEHGTQLGMDIWGTSIWVFISFMLFKNKFFLSI